MSAQMKLRWVASPTVSSFHAADALLRKQRLADMGLTEALLGPVTALARSMAVDAVSREHFLLHLVPLAASAEGKQQLAHQILIRTGGRGRADFLAAKYRGHLIDVDEAFKAQLPRVGTTLTLQPEHLKDQWHRHGPGLLADIAHQTERTILVAEAAVLLVHPVLGGGGTAYLPYNSACVEAGATDPVPGLPEVLRFVWLLSQLNLDLPRYSDPLRGRHRVATVGALAMISVALAAADTHKLASCDDGTIRLAMQKWLPLQEQGDEAAVKLCEWWQVYRDARPPWPTALAALDRLLA